MKRSSKLKVQNSKKEEGNLKSQKSKIDCDCRDLENQIEELTNQLKRALADYQNLKRRVDEEKKIFTLTANLSLLESVLDVVDDFDLAMNKIQESGEDLESGLQMICQKLQRLLENQNVTEIKTEVVDDFNPKVHEGVGMITVIEKEQEDKIAGIARKGYMMGENVLRPVRVVVGKLG